MTLVFFEAVTGHGIKSQDFGTEYWIFLDLVLDINFGTVFGYFKLNFRDCFRIVRTEFLGLFSNSTG